MLESKFNEGRLTAIIEKAVYNAVTKTQKKAIDPFWDVICFHSTKQLSRFFGCSYYRAKKWKNKGKINFSMHGSNVFYRIADVLAAIAGDKEISNFFTKKLTLKTCNGGDKHLKKIPRKGTRRPTPDVLETLCVKVLQCDIVQCDKIIEYGKDPENIYYGVNG